MVARVSLAELAAAGFSLRSAEAAAIVIDVCRQLERGAIRGIPSTHVIRLTPDGTIVAEGPITTDQPPIAKAALLLNDLLPAFDAPPAYRVPGGLRLVAARALGTLDLPPFGSLEEFCTALSRFAADDLATAVGNLYHGWELAKSPRALTISDVRRARRATGLSLGDISSVCGVDAALLRELEWGYLKNWRNDAVGRSWLSGYAKASGLDETLVTSIVVPMLDDAASQPAHQAIAERDETTLVAADPQTVVATAPAEPRRRRRRALLWAGASAASIALLAIITMLAWPRPDEQARLELTAPPLVTAPVAAPIAVTPLADVVPAVRTHATPKPHVAKARSTVKRATSPPRKAAPKQNFFKRALLRIVIK
jgi:hypothetical protein